MSNREEEWETEEVDVAKPVGTVISVRFPAALAERIFAEAERTGVKTSAVVRQAVEKALEDGAERRSAAMDVTISSGDGTSVVLYTGRSASGRTLSSPATFELTPT